MALVSKNALIQIRIAQADLDRFRALAERDRRSVSDVLRQWIYQSIDQEEKRLQRLSQPFRGGVLPVPQPMPPTPPMIEARDPDASLSRQQRRALEREERKHRE